MGKNQSASNLTNVIQVSSTGNVLFVSGSTTLMSISSSGAITTTGVISGSNALSASYAASASNALFAQTASYWSGSITNALSASYSSTSTSASYAASASNAISGAYAVNSTTASYAVNATTGAYAANAQLFNNTASSVFATTGSNILTGTQYVSNTNNAIGFSNTTSSIYTDGGLQVTKDAYISSSLYIKGNLTVYGTQSVSYISSSTLNVGTNLITVNTATPSVRFGGLAVQDSGSVNGLTGSLLWDSQNNNWIYDNPSGSGNYDSAMVIMGPRNSSALGSEVGLNCNYLVLGHGSHHTTSSAIFHDGTNTCIPNTLLASGCIGIGTSSPYSTLTVGNSDTTSVITPGGNNTHLTIKTLGAAGAFRVYSISGSTGNLATTESFRVDAGGNVGVGTTSPSVKLHVNGQQYLGTASTTTGQLYLFNSSNDTRFDILNNGTEFKLASTYLSTAGYMPITFYTGDTERMRITSGGLVQINHTNTAKGNLDVASDVNAVPLVIRGRSADGEGQVEFWNYAGSTRYGVLGSTSNYTYFGSIANTPLFFQTNSTERMRITSTGIACFACQVCAPYFTAPGVAICGTNGYTWLTLEGLKDGSSNTTVGMCINTRHRSGGINNVNHYGLVVTPNFETNSSNLGTVYGAYIAPSETGTYNVDTAFGLFVKGMCVCSGTLTNSFAAVFLCGNVGIGTSSPTAPLTVQSNTSAYGIDIIGRSSGDISAITFKNNANNTELAQILAASTYMTFSTAATERMRITSGGNVGIGSSSPNAPLDVTSTTSTSSGIQQWSYNSSPASYRLQLNTLVCSGLVRYSFDMLNAGASYNCVLTFDRGMVGVGGSPTQLFTIKNPSTHTYMEMNTVSSAYAAWILYSAGGANKWLVGLEGSSDNYYLYNTVGTAGYRLTLTQAGVLSTTGGGTSDCRVKHCIQYICSNTLPIINQLKPVSFIFNEDVNKQTRHGFIAQDVLNVKPDLVLGDGACENGTYGLDYDGIIALLVKGMQEQQCRITLLESCLGIA